ncbi:hypothetical protein Verru16b_01210 [Lacunisphaera limnophila]|uniref:PEP-CTERM protein-sorting domain-containing protein n=1 Tax=Lacunisphaera limnophila TaxID=1838286 RepID=A0A1D8ATD4_9BACT|nr:hypothetical protein [Lacunisphaera limnophila]AOS44149.1 hypothetical protein Verru16b_01210 [Lacunisphaera limnophila]
MPDASTSAQESPSTSSAASASLLDRARQLIQRGCLAAAPLAAAVVVVAATPAAQAQVTVDYSGVTTYSNSGWFTGLFIDEAAAGGTVTGNTANLTGDRTITDSLFWRYDSYYDKTVPRADTTGLGFFWGGALTNQPAVSGDKMSATLAFSIDFEHTVAGEYDDPQISYELIIGYGSSPYAIDYGYIQSPRNTSDSYNNTTGGFYGEEAVSPLYLTATLDLNLSEGSTANYWFAQLNVNWNHEYAHSWYWDDNYSKLNGDEFRAFGTVDVTLQQAAAIPEPAHVALGLGAAAILALAARRRWTARA